MFPLFLKITADVMAPRLSVVFRWLVRLGSFPPCWRQDNITPIPKGPPSSSVANYRRISITSALSKVFELLVSVGLGRFMERIGVLKTTEFAYRKIWVPVMHFWVCPIHCRVHWRVGKRLGSCRFILVQPLIGLTIRPFSIGSALWVLDVLCCLYNYIYTLTQFLLNRSQHVMVDGCRSKLVDVVSGVPQGSVLRPLLLILCTSQFFSILENKLVGYADDTTLMAVVPSPGVRVTVAESLM